MKIICSNNTAAVVSTSALNKHEYRFVWKHKPLVVPEDIDEVRHVKTIGIWRWIFSLVKCHNKLYIWAVNLIEFVEFDWDINILDMFDFLIDYTPAEIFSKCSQDVWKYYLRIKEQRWKK